MRADTRAAAKAMCFVSAHKRVVDCQALQQGSRLGDDVSAAAGLRAE
jgi:hypothetical protein